MIMAPSMRPMAPSSVRPLASPCFAVRINKYFCDAFRYKYFVFAILRHDKYFTLFSIICLIARPRMFFWRP